MSAPSQNDRNLVSQARMLTEGLAALEKRVEQARIGWIELDRRRLIANVEAKPEPTVKRLTAEANEARESYEALVEYCDKQITDYAEYIRNVVRDGR